MERTNFENSSEAPRLIAVVVALTALSCIVVSLRVWVRLQLTKQGLGPDDAFMLAAVAFNITESTIICVSTKYGLGRHIQYVGIANIVVVFQLAYASVLTYITLIFLIKTSLISFYRRLSASTYFHAWCWSYMGLITALWLVFFLAAVFACKPVEFFWDKSIPGGQCVDLEKLYLANASLSVMMDVAVLLLPVRAVWKLTMSKRQKTELAGLFLSGSFICIASFVRMTTFFNCNTKDDSTWALVKTHVWSMIEVNIAIITVSSPAVRPFFTRHVWGRVFHLSIHGSNNGRSKDDQQNNNQPDPLNKLASRAAPNAKIRETDVSTEHSIEQEMAHYGVKEFDAERAIAMGVLESAGTSTRELAIADWE